MSETCVSCWKAALVVCAAAGLMACRSTGAAAYSPEHSSQYTGNKIDPASDEEAALLRKVQGLVTGEQQVVGDLLVVADAPYFAASGRTCRALLIKRKGNRDDAITRLACEDDGVWFFAPRVMRPDAR
ncbi:MAG: hypothetical protein ACOC1F_10165 [Myxococcota bacterium]